VHGRKSEDANPDLPEELKKLLTAKKAKKSRKDRKEGPEKSDHRAIDGSGRRRTEKALNRKESKEEAQTPRRKPTRGVISPH
jgi:hypothetical protein